MSRRSLSSVFTPHWFLYLLSFLRQVSFGCNIFTICQFTSNITCNVTGSDGRWTLVTSPAFCEKDTVNEETMISANPGSKFSWYKLTEANLSGLQSRALVLKLGISLIEAGAFQRLASNLVELDISENRLSNFSKGVFRGLNKVRRLNLSLNNFTAVPSEALEALSALRVLLLTNNQIRHIRADDFVTSPSLTSLDLSYNDIESIDASAFLPLGNLQNLDIHDNVLMCDCSLLWLRFYLNNSCVCVLGEDACAAPVYRRGYTVLNYPAAGCITTRAEVACGRVNCVFVSGQGNITSDNSVWGDSALETGAEGADEEAGEEEDIMQPQTYLSPTEDDFFTTIHDRNASRGVLVKIAAPDLPSGSSSPASVPALSTTPSPPAPAFTLSPNPITPSSPPAPASPQTPKPSALLSTSPESRVATTWLPGQNPKATKRATEGWMAALLIGGLFLLIVMIIGAIHFGQRVKRHCPMGHSGQPLATIDTGQVMYASSYLMDDTDERTAVSDITDM